MENKPLDNSTKSGSFRWDMAALVALAVGLPTAVGYIQECRISAFKEDIARVTEELTKCRALPEQGKKDLAKCRRDLETCRQECKPEAVTPPGDCEQALEECEKAKAVLEQDGQPGGPPGGGVACGGKIHFGRTAVGSILEPTGTCKYSFSVGSSAKIHVKMARAEPQDKLKPHFGIYNSSGDRLVESGNGFFGQEQTSYTLPAAGTYRILADGFDNTTGRFKLTVECLSGDCR